MPMTAGTIAIIGVIAANMVIQEVKYKWGIFPGNCIRSAWAQDSGYRLKFKNITLDERVWLKYNISTIIRLSKPDTFLNIERRSLMFGVAHDWNAEFTPEQLDWQKKTINNMNLIKEELNKTIFLPKRFFTFNLCKDKIKMFFEVHPILENDDIIGFDIITDKPAFRMTGWSEELSEQYNKAGTEIATAFLTKPVIKMFSKTGITRISSFCNCG